jgi:hypothetical protein
MLKNLERKRILIMQNTFKEYNQYTEQEFKKLWENCLFVFDTNTLLNMYRYSRETVEIYFKVLTRLKKNNQLWIPYQVGHEFYENRINVIFEYEKSYDEILSILENTKNDIETKYKDHPFLNLEDINHKIKDGLKNTETAIRKAKNNHPKWLEKDDVLDKINNLFKDNVGKNYDEEKLEEIKKEGALRYSKKIPPGFKDIKKEESKRYGDLILWYQIIDKAKENNQPIIFISGDVKEDWWLEKNGKRLMPLPQLKKEIYEKANVDFHIYTADRFLKLSETEENKISSKTIKEIRKIRELEEKRMMIKRREFLEKNREFNHINNEQYSMQYLNFIEKLERLIIEINHSDIQSKYIEDLNHMFHKIKRFRNIIFHERNNQKFIHNIYRYINDVLLFIERLIHIENIPPKLSRKIRKYIDNWEGSNYSGRYL